MPDLTCELRLAGGTWMALGVDLQAAAGAVVAAWRRGDLLGLRACALTVQEVLALEPPAMTYARAQLHDPLGRRLARAYRRGCTLAADACPATASCSRRHRLPQCPQARRPLLSIG